MRIIYATFVGPFPSFLPSSRRFVPPSRRRPFSCCVCLSPSPSWPCEGTINYYDYGRTCLFSCTSGICGWSKRSKTWISFSSDFCFCDFLKSFLADAAAVPSFVGQPLCVIWRSWFEAEEEGSVLNRVPVCCFLPFVVVVLGRRVDYDEADEL